MRIDIRRTAVAVAGILALTGGARANSIFSETGHTGAQVQLDSSHTQHWTYTVTEDVTDMAGGLFTMKRGSSTAAAIEFELFAGTFSDWGTAADLLSVTKGPSDFTQHYSLIAFQGTHPITLHAGTTYTAVLSSGAANPQSRAYFIKGATDGDLSFADRNGTIYAGGGQVASPQVSASVPTPAAAAGGVALLIPLAVKRVRRAR